ncbi:MAG: FkbM family methyltransferase [Anaerolineales bacterium]|nr:FkbM family methyltransferase [Anaerolineales bacterium]
MNEYIFRTFRKIAKLFSGYKIRDRFQWIDQLYKRVNRGLAPKTARVHGHTMFIDQDDSMGLALNGEYEPVETKLILELVKPGAAILDIGANIGYYSLLFAKLTGPSGQVFAFEPDPYSYDLLQQNILENGYTNIFAFQLGVSDQNEELVLCRDPFNNLDHRVLKSDVKDNIENVRVVKLDDFLQEHSARPIDFIKMDIQGSEGWALEGMKELIKDSKTIQILTEYEPQRLDQSGYGGVNFLLQLEKMGFELIDIDQNFSAYKPISLEELTQKYPEGYSGHTNLLCRLMK